MIQSRLKIFSPRKSAKISVVVTHTWRNENQMFVRIDSARPYRSRGVTRGAFRVSRLVGTSQRAGQVTADAGAPCEALYSRMRERGKHADATRWPARLRAQCAPLPMPGNLPEAGETALVITL